MTLAKLPSLHFPFCIPGHSPSHKWNHSLHGQWCTGALGHCGIHCLTKHGCYKTLKVFNCKSFLRITTVLYKRIISKSKYLQVQCALVWHVVSFLLSVRLWWALEIEGNGREDKLHFDVLALSCTTEVTKDPQYLCTNLFAFKPKELCNPMQGQGEKH